ncbi:hypothetical protein SRB17_83030 [Streptomyces sp. RB17]|uniref:hypothetical protein n=1 Tax=Streptomyces sp. RB17 TaxID=2585197 RepID=UPI001295ED93|nr:hypothetical protein [Streptomyces sp. RB17]MQY40272.1 hypothetical protein [Streptomyces sp. RB17]
MTRARADAGDLVSDANGRHAIAIVTDIRRGTDWGGAVDPIERFCVGVWFTGHLAAAVTLGTLITDDHQDLAAVREEALDRALRDPASGPRWAAVDVFEVEAGFSSVLSDNPHCTLSRPV